MCHSAKFYRVSFNLVLVSCASTPAHSGLDNTASHSLDAASHQLLQYLSGPSSNTLCRSQGSNHSATILRSSADSRSHMLVLSAARWAAGRHQALHQAASTHHIAQPPPHNTPSCTSHATSRLHMHASPWQLSDTIPPMQCPGCTATSSRSGSPAAAHTESLGAAAPAMSARHWARLWPRAREGAPAGQAQRPATK